MSLPSTAPAPMEYVGVEDVVAENTSASDVFVYLCCEGSMQKRADRDGVVPSGNDRLGLSWTHILLFLAGQGQDI